MRKIVLGIGGSSGAIYAERLLKKFTEILDTEDDELGVVMSKNAKENWRLELNNESWADFPFPIYENNDFYAPFASGSALYDTMLICPCSMGLLSRIATGTSHSLISRTADVMLKERRNLIVVPRETPLNLIHLRNMTTITEAGGIVCPASPSFYSKPETINDVIDSVIHRLLDLANLKANAYRWGDD